TLNSLATPPPRDAKMAGPIYRDAWESAESGNYEGGKNLLNELRNLDVPERYLTALEKQLNPP
ncbi:MAG: hypothetical protein GWO24_29115, partial [Akkermansiaceae bacterium]|nr:hypothetical protein [Akkermansiaceae bacterium]